MQYNHLGIPITTIELRDSQEAAAYFMTQCLVRRHRQPFIKWPKIATDQLAAVMREATTTLSAAFPFPWKIIGKGSNAFCFELGCGNVLRVCFHPFDGTYYYHQRCLEAREPWMPTVQAVYRFQNSVFASVLEKVNVFDTSAEGGVADKAAECPRRGDFWKALTLGPDGSAQDLDTVVSSDVPLDYVLIYMLSRSFTLVEFIDQCEAIAHFFTEDFLNRVEQFVAILQPLFEKFENMGVHQLLDCSHQNLGLRLSNNELVVLDPFCLE